MTATSNTSMAIGGSSPERLRSAGNGAMEGRGTGTAVGKAVRLFGTRIDPLRMTEAVSRLREWAVTPQEICRYVVTPNVDHVVLLNEHAGFRAAYADADLVVADGAPLIRVSRWLGAPLPERVAGVDLTERMLGISDVGRPLRVYLLGGMPGVGQRAAQTIARRWPTVQVVGIDSPPFGFERSDEQNAAVLRGISAVEPDLLVLALGSPKQELWVHAHRTAIRARVALCVGATIDFLAGEKQRAPLWMRRAGLEWVHRLASEPSRLGRRYARDAWIFPRLVAREWWGRLRAR